MKINNRRKKFLLKNTIIFTISSLATKLISFFLVPIYTNELTTIEYGIVDLLFTVCTFLYPLFTLNIVEGIYRFSLDKDIDYNKINSIGFFCAILCIFLSLIIIPILQFFPNYEKFSIYVYMYLISFSISQIFLVSLKGQEKLKLFSVGNILNTFLIGFFNILFLVIFNFGVKGYFISYIFANIIVAIFGFIYGKQYISLKKFTFEKKLFVDMAKYSLVLMPTSFLWWIVNFSDRIMISHYVGLSANGIYAISYKIPSLLTMISSIFNQAWVFSAVADKDSNDIELYTNNVFHNFFLILILISMFVIIFIKYFFQIYVSTDFFDAWKYVPILVLGFVFMTSSTFISTSYNVYKDSKGFLISALIGAGLNIILNFILIPKFYVYGAAIATCFSYIVIFLYRFFDTQKYIKLKFGLNQIFQITILLVFVILSFINNLKFTILKVLILLLFLFIYGKNIIILIIDIFKIKRRVR